MNKRLYKSSTERKICGVCGGIAEYFNLDPTVVRLAIVLLTLLSAGTGVVFYLIAAVLMPQDTDIR